MAATTIVAQCLWYSRDVLGLCSMVPEEQLSAWCSALLDMERDSLLLQGKPLLQGSASPGSCLERFFWYGREGILSMKDETCLSFLLLIFWPTTWSGCSCRGTGRTSGFLSSLRVNRQQIVSLLLVPVDNKRSASQDTSLDCRNKKSLPMFKH